MQSNYNEQENSSIEESYEQWNLKIEENIKLWEWRFMRNLSDKWSKNLITKSTKKWKLKEYEAMQL